MTFQDQTPLSGFHILIADDNRQFLKDIGLALQRAPDIHLSTASSIDDLREALKSTTFDLVLLDREMPGMRGGETLRQIARLNGSLAVGILTATPTRQIFEEMLKSGAAGVIPKTTSMRSFANALRFMAAGERYFPLELMQEQKVDLNSAIPALTERELSVLRELANGKPNREIGLSLALAEATIKMHVKSICRKLGASNRTQAVIQARNLQLV